MSDKTIQAKELVEASSECATNELPLVEKIVLRLVATIFGVIGFGLATRVLPDLWETFAKGKIAEGLISLALTFLFGSFLLYFIWKTYTNPSAFKSASRRRHESSMDFMDPVTESMVLGTGPLRTHSFSRSNED